MHGVVSLLDEEHYELVETIWADMRTTLGLEGIYVTPYPHFSYHVAEHYDTDTLRAMLEYYAATTPPFRVHTTGLGVFTGGLARVIYVNVVRSPVLNAVHHSLWPLLTDASAGIIEYYHPEQWVPHITLGHGDVTGANLPDVIRLLNKYDFNWTIEVDNIALLYADGETMHDETRFRLPLKG